jgi:hypothetical protein
VVQFVGEDEDGGGVGQQLAGGDDVVLLEAEGVSPVDRVQQNLQLDAPAGAIQVLGDDVAASRVADEDEAVLDVGDDAGDAVVEDGLDVLVHPVDDGLEGLGDFFGVGTLEFGNLDDEGGTEM